MKQFKTLNVSGTTIIARKLFGMDEYTALKEDGKLGNYLELCKEEDELKNKEDTNKSISGAIIHYVFAGLFLLIVRQAIVWMLGDIGKDRVVTALILFGLTVFVVMMIGECVRIKRGKDNLEKVTTAKTRLEDLMNMELLGVLQNHANLVGYSSNTLTNLKNLVNYLDEVPDTYKGMNAYLYQDPTDSDKNDKTKSILFSTDDKNTYVRYAFTRLEEDTDTSSMGNSLLSVSTYELKLDDRHKLTEMYAEKLKYLEFM